MYCVQRDNLVIIFKISRLVEVKILLTQRFLFRLTSNPSASKKRSPEAFSELCTKFARDEKTDEIFAEFDSAGCHMAG